MIQFGQCLVVACLFVAALCVGPRQVGVAAGGEKGKGEKRAALWKALHKALPKKYKKIDVYAENSSLSEVLFRSQGTTLRFSLRTGKVEPVLHMKALPKINRITYEKREAGGSYALWYNGHRELTISADE